MRRILGAARTILKRDGLEALTTVRIAAEAEIPVGSFYQYFANKEAVLVAIYREYLQEMLEMARNADAAARIHGDWRGYVEAFIRYSRTSERRDTVIFELFNAIRTYPELEELDIAHVRQVVLFIAERLHSLGAQVSRPQLERLATFLFEVNNAAWAYQTRVGDACLEAETTEWVIGAMLGVLAPSFESQG